MVSSFLINTEKSVFQEEYAMAFTNEYLAGVYEKVVRDNPGETEFHQTFAGSGQRTILLSVSERS